MPTRATGAPPYLAARNSAADCASARQKEMLDAIADEAILRGHRRSRAARET